MTSFLASNLRLVYTNGMMKTPDYHTFYNVHDMLDRLIKLEQQIAALVKALKWVDSAIETIEEPGDLIIDGIRFQINQALALVEGDKDG